MKWIASTALTFFSTVVFAVPIQAYYDLGTPTGFVNDYANILSDQEEVALETKLDLFTSSSSNEIAVVTVASLHGDTIENFADTLFVSWGIGKKDKDNGALLLVALEDREMRIEVGYGLEGALTDAQSSWIIRDIMQPAFTDGQYYQGINGAVDKIISVTEGEYLPTSEGSSEGLVTQLAPMLGGIFFFAAWLFGRSKSYWAGGLVGVIIGGLIGGLFSLTAGVVAAIILGLFGLLFDYIVSKSGGGGFGGGGFGSGSTGGGSSSWGGFGGGRSGGGGASGRW